MKRWEKRKRYERRTPHNVRVVSGLGPSKETAHAVVRCDHCGAFITYDTCDGQLVALEAHNTFYHRHQPPWSDPARNRRMVKLNLQKDGYPKYLTKVRAS